jgi:hypothetical protein
MLTDDDLTRQLRGAYRAATEDVGYAGAVPAPRRTAPAAVPVAATAVASAALAGAWVLAPDDPVAPPSATGAPSPSAPTHHAARMVTDTIRVAGFTFRYRHAASQPAGTLYAVHDPGRVPDDATPISAPDGVRAWVGKDAPSGDAALWVKAPTRNGGALFALMSPTWTTDELADLFHHGDPRPVPVVDR